MKIPKTIKKFCKFCKKHTEQKIAQAKRKSPGSVHTQSYGSKVRQKAKHRGIDIGFGNHGRFSRPPVNKRKMTGKKQTKKTDIRYTCNVCKKSTVEQDSRRAKKVEMV